MRSDTNQMKTSMRSDYCGTLREAERSDDEAEGASDPSAAPTATTPDSAAEGGAEQEDSP